MSEFEKMQREAGVSLDIERMPRHVAIIMDGNGRWATRQGLPRLMGHMQGYQATREIVRAAGEIGLEALTLYTFSTENWSRGPEADKLMEIYEQAAKDELPTLQENKVRFRVSGFMPGLPQSLQDALDTNTRETAGNTGLVLNLAMNYGGRQEILQAVKSVCARASEGALNPDDLDEKLFSEFLYTAGLPDPDLLIRTAGEMRVSNFLLWQIAYAEIWVTETLWPDFAPKDLVIAISDYQQRTRRFGAVVE